MVKHSRNQRQTASKPKQRTKESGSERTSHEPTAHLGSNDDQGQDVNTITHSEARLISHEQIDEGVQEFGADSMMVADRSIEVEVASSPHEWGSNEANLHLEAPAQVLQGPVDGPLSASDFNNDLIEFRHIGAHVPNPTHFDTRFTRHTLPQWSWEAPVTTPQTIALSTSSSYNASTAAIAYQSPYDSPVTEVYSRPTATTLDTLPATTQYQLERWVYENDHDEVTPTDRMEGYNYNV
ncbi:uncharacterized protein EAF02_003820 [Botrytis sinoallii]|uniref:uncharacterized protein n=1 Tax=Botrytis sinoallii TaxID=1463999 RepID=UPI0019026FA8|nr:uncharacterized protein EAF02_003820 [Botrytis sinoallii]KAF7887173.1 hypothetical protein EAF02_003820 [Botrytis sinoallii]